MPTFRAQLLDKIGGYSSCAENRRRRFVVRYQLREGRVFYIKYHNRPYVEGSVRERGGERVKLQKPIQRGEAPLRSLLQPKREDPSA